MMKSHSPMHFIINYIDDVDIFGSIHLSNWLTAEPVLFVC